MQQQYPSQVNAPCGVVHGSLEDGVHVFRGIPYAAPPVGLRRFAPPVPVAASEHIDATSFGSISLQDIDPLPDAIPGVEHNFYARGARPDEDCLNLNVWSPDPSGKAPVYVYIHGGAFLFGSGTGPWISGKRHAHDHGIVVVTLNYRLGLLGGLYLGDQDPTLSNFAIQDQIEALRWIRQNISAFGGDPDNVTIGGQSAGGMSVVALLNAPAATGLFQRAIVESGHADVFVPVDEAQRATRTVLERLHIDPDADDVLVQLRTASTLRIAAAQREFGLRVRTFPLVADDVVINAEPLGALANGAARDVDLLIGTTAEEDNLFTITGWASPVRSIPEALADLLTDDDAITRGIKLYEAAAEQGMDAAAINHLIATEHSWIEPTRAVALAHAAAGGRTYHYEFAWASPVERVGAAHLVDLPFFMGNLDEEGVSELLGDGVRSDPDIRTLGEQVSAVVADFVRTGDLSRSSLGPWPMFTETHRNTMIIDTAAQVALRRRGAVLDFWASQRGSARAPLSTTGTDS